MGNSQTSPGNLAVPSRAYLVAKRGVDVVAAAVGLAVLSPVFGALGAWIKVDSPGPVFFRQWRIGKDGTEFRIYKFRTMRTDAPKDTPTHLLTDPNRHVTASGRFLRATSLDELPQLVNVLLGQMSLVGPRPALWNQDDLIAARERVGANGVRPGLTGWAQINGRDELPISVKADLDGYYVRHMSWRTDLRCLLATLTSVARGEGYVEGGTGTLGIPEQAPEDEAARAETSR